MKILTRSITRQRKRPEHPLRGEGLINNFRSLRRALNLILEFSSSTGYATHPLKDGAISAFEDHRQICRCIRLLGRATSRCCVFMKFFSVAAQGLDLTPKPHQKTTSSKQAGRDQRVPRSFVAEGVFGKREDFRPDLISSPTILPDHTYRVGSLSEERPSHQSLEPSDQRPYVI